MEEESRLQSFLSFIFTRSPKQWVAFVLVVAGFLYLTYLSINFSVVWINVIRHDGIVDSSSFYGLRKDMTTEERYFSIGNLVLARKDTVSLRVIAGEYQTSKRISTLPAVGFSSETINLYKDRDVEKYSGDSLGCITYDPGKDAMLSYKCTKPVYLVHYARPLSTTAYWENKTVANFIADASSVTSVHPFRGGALALLQPAGGERTPRDVLHYVDSGGNRATYEPPRFFDMSDLGKLSVVTDTEAAESNSFLLVNDNGELHYGTTEGSTVTYKSMALSDKYNPEFDTLLCRLLGPYVYCYYGEGIIDHLDEQPNYRKHAHKGIVEVINFGTEKPTSSVYAFSDSMPIAKLYVTQARKLYAVSSNITAYSSLYELELSGGKVTSKPFMSNISSMSTGNGVLYIQNDAVYKVDDKSQESYLVFSSPNLKLSNVVTVGSHIFINAFVKDDPAEKLHTYKILDHASDLPIGKRPVDLLPFYIRGVTQSVDYSKEAIRIRVFATPTSNSQTGRLTYDEGEYQANKLRVEERLNSLGLNLDKYQVLYSK